MINLGHIIYANCFPIHARLLAEGPPEGVRITPGIPSELNRALNRGEVDVAPCSSIEYARNAPRYRVLDGLAIASDGPVESILLESLLPADGLDGRIVAVPTASATSVVLLRTLFHHRWRANPVFRWFDQTTDPDPLTTGAAAALRIGDVALTRTAPRGRHVTDLGLEWTEWTGLPFVYALWQTRLERDRDEALLELRSGLLDSRAWFARNIGPLSRRYAVTFGLPPDRLAAYWARLRYDFDDRARRGILHFYALAAELGEAPAVPSIDMVPSA
jgi:chorismate dehydratase